MRRKSKGGESKARKCTAAQERKPDSICGGHTMPHVVGTVPNCPALSVPSVRHLAKLETKSNCNDFIWVFENKTNSS